MKAKQKIPQLFTKADISRFYNTSPNTVNSYIMAGLLKPIPKPVDIKRDYFARQEIERVFGRIYEEEL